MSYYYKYNFTTPEGVYAIVKEELKSYFDTGAIDDLAFPLYVNKCLRKLGQVAFPITEEVLYIEDYEARLPDNFYAVREAWLCTEINGMPYQSANSFYSQAATSTTIQIAPLTIGGQPCTNPDCVDGCDECMPQIAQAVYKTNNQVTRTYVREYLLKPGNISAKSSCDVDYMDNWEMYAQSGVIHQFTPYSSGYDSFDIRGNKFVTNFRTGIVNLVFYSTAYDDVENQMIPDNYRVMEFIEAFIKYKVFETLTNQTNDETFNQLEKKMLYYKQLADEAFILADIEMKKETVWEKQRRIKQTLNRHKMYELPNRINRYGWRRNN